MKRREKKLTDAFSLRTLYPRLNAEEIGEVEETLDRYLRLVLRIHTRRTMEAASPTYEDILTESEVTPTINDERSNQ